MEWLGFKNQSQITSKTRTEGDGMESTQIQEHKTDNRDVSGSNPKRNPLVITKLDNQIKTESRFPHNIKLGTLVNLTPTEIKYVNRKPKCISKEPKFVPYEPYKAATRPIISLDKDKICSKKKSTKNNMDLNTLVSQMALVDTNPIPFQSSKKPFKVFTEETLQSDIASDISKKQRESELTQMKNEMLALKNENESLKEQVKQQAQVNKELKTMLVASMGEDLETTVQTLTEDKQLLATALIDSTKHLSTHQEQTEWLAGQCEVWRSKFLASSLMVEELVGWKNSLSQRMEELQISLQQILEERNRVRDILVHTYRNLQSLHENWLTNLASKETYSLNEFGGFGVVEQTPIGSINLTCSRPKSSNILDLSTVNLKFSENLCVGVEKIDDFTDLLNELPINTDAENSAEKLLATPLQISQKNDHPSSALVNLAYTKTGMTPKIACCSHCNGQVQLL